MRCTTSVSNGTSAAAAEPGTHLASLTSAPNTSADISFVQVRVVKDCKWRLGSLAFTTVEMTVSIAAVAVPATEIAVVAVAEAATVKQQQRQKQKLACKCVTAFSIISG